MARLKERLQKINAVELSLRAGTCCAASMPVGHKHAHIINGIIEAYELPRGTETSSGRNLLAIATANA